MNIVFTFFRWLLSLWRKLLGFLGGGVLESKADYEKIVSDLLDINASLEILGDLLTNKTFSNVVWNEDNPVTTTVTRPTEDKNDWIVSTSYVPLETDENVSGGEGINPKDAIGEVKPSLGLVPPALTINTARVFELGAKKYGAYNWRGNPVKSMVYINAALRHLLSFLDGETTDAESGVSHLAHVAACCGILLDAEENDVLRDDRPLPGNAAGLIARLTAARPAKLPAKSKAKSKCEKFKATMCNPQNRKK